MSMKDEYEPTTDCCDSGIDKYGCCSMCGEYQDSGWEEDDFKSPNQKTPFFTRKLNDTTRITEQKINVIKEDLNEYLAKKTMKNEGWRVYRTVIKTEIADGHYEHKINPLVLQAIPKIKNKKKILQILNTPKGLPDLIAIKEKEIKFVELKGFDFPELNENQQPRLNEIKKAGFSVEIQKRKFKIDITLEEEKNEICD